MWRRGGNEIPSKWNVAKNVGSACFWHPVLCANLGKDALGMLTAEGGWQGRWTPEVQERARKLIVNFVANAIEDPEAVRDLLVRLEIDRSWLPCFGLSSDDLVEKNRFEAALRRFLELSANITPDEVAKRKAMSGDELKSYLRTKLDAVEQLWNRCYNAQPRDLAACQQVAARIHPNCPIHRYVLQLATPAQPHYQYGNSPMQGAPQAQQYGIYGDWPIPQTQYLARPAGRTGGNYFASRNSRGFTGQEGTVAEECSRWSAIKNGARKKARKRTAM